MILHPTPKATFICLLKIYFLNILSVSVLGCWDVIRKQMSVSGFVHIQGYVQRRKHGMLGNSLKQALTLASASYLLFPKGDNIHAKS